MVIQVKARLNSPKPSLNKYQLQFASLPLDSFGVSAGGAGMLGAFGRGTCYSVLEKKALLIVKVRWPVWGPRSRYDNRNRVHMGTAAEHCASRRCPTEAKGGIEWSKDDPFLAALRRCGPSREHVSW